MSVASTTSEYLLTAMLNYTERTNGNGAPTVDSCVDCSASSSLLKSPKLDSVSVPNSLDCEQLEARSQSEPMLVKLNESRWNPISSASKCADPKCRKRFTSLLHRRRNCSMCGEVFCRGCTIYRRKISANAKPDPLGTFFNVCKCCYYLESDYGMSTDLFKEFSEHRSAMFGLKNAAVNTDLRNPLCGQKLSALKCILLKLEVQKLSEGYKANTGLLRGILSEVKVPAWQKLPQWVDSRKASGCFNCGHTFGLLSGKLKKLNCRVGGQVFCSDCCKDEIVLYCEDEEIKWAINGKQGGPSVTPSSYMLLPICCHCSHDLQAIVPEQVPSSSQCTSYLQTLHLRRQKLSKLEEKIETALPEYMKVVDALDVTNNSPRSISGRNPLQILVKVQTDLSDVFSSLAVQSQSLKHLKPETETEKKLHRNVTIGTYRYYSENMFQFRLFKNRLCELIPTDHLEEIQQSVSQRSMERVHVYLQQLMFELLDLKKRYYFNDDFFEPIMDTIRSMEEELRPFLEYRNESWEKHAKCSLDFVRCELEAGHRALTLDAKLNDQALVRCIVIGQISSRLHECYRELQAKTIDREFLKTKQSVHDAFVTIDNLLAQ